MKNLKERQKGFTLIEIVLVLAIAGLILLMVFLAVSGAQRSRRDTQREEDAGRIASQLEQYASNNSGDYPGTAAALGTFVTNYLTPTTDYQDPSTGATYKLTYTTNAPAALGDVSYHLGEICSGGTMTATGAQPNDYALVVDLETATACRSNGN